MAVENAGITYPVLSLAERDRRFRLARDFMEEHGLDALVMMAGGHRMFRHWGTNQYYLSNEPDAMGATVIFPRNSDPVLLLIRQQWQLLITDVRDGIEPWIEDFRLAEPPTTLLSVLADKTLENAHIGVITGGAATPYGSLSDPAWQAVQTALPGIKAEDVCRSFTFATMPKSAEELELARAAGRASERAAAALVEVAGTGVSEVELYAAVAEQLARGGVDWSSYLMTVGKQVMGIGQPRWTLPHRRPRTLSQGDVIIAEFFAVYGGVETQHMVSVHVGDPSENILKVAEVARAAYDACLENLKPGVTFESVRTAMQQPIEEGGCWDWNPLLHTLPLQLVGSMHLALPGRTDVHESERTLSPWPPKALAAVPAMDRGAEFVLSEGMLFANEPGVALGDDKLMFGGLVATTESGSEALTTNGAELYVVD